MRNFKENIESDMTTNFLIGLLYGRISKRILKATSSLFFTVLVVVNLNFKENIERLEGKPMLDLNLQS